MMLKNREGHELQGCGDDEKRAQATALKFDRERRDCGVGHYFITGNCSSSKHASSILLLTFTCVMPTASTMPCHISLPSFSFSFLLVSEHRYYV